MVALACMAMIRHDAESMHATVLRELLEARHSTQLAEMVESLAEEAQGLVRHLMHRGVPGDLDLLADAAGDLLEHASPMPITGAARARARALLRDACRAMRASGEPEAPLDHILRVQALSAGMPEVASCTAAHLEALAHPITQLLLELFGS